MTWVYDVHLRGWGCHGRQTLYPHGGVARELSAFIPRLLCTAARVIGEPAPAAPPE